MNYNIRAHQLMMLDMLSEIDRICTKYGIKYTLFAGTLLGAVRHHGFIPWDDDLDIIMLRPEYEFFLTVAQKELNQELFYLQCEFSAHWPMFFSKLRRNGTACIERYIPKDFKTHMGVYIDIFPCDNLYNNLLLRKLQFLASKVIIAQALGKRGYKTNNIFKKIIITLTRKIPTHFLMKFIRYQNGNDSKMVHTFFAASSKYCKNIYPRYWFLQTTSIPFEGKAFPVSIYYHELLTQMYGDYQTPTPVNAREKKVHGEIVDLMHSYTDYQDIQKNLKINVHTRSIR